MSDTSEKTPVISSVERALRGILWGQGAARPPAGPEAVPDPPVVTAVVVVIGAGVLAWSLGIEAGNSTFYVATSILAAIWAVGAFASGPLHLGRIQRRRSTDLGRPVVSGILLGLVLAGIFVVGALLVRQIPVLDRQVASVLDHASAGVTPLLVLITVVNGIAEELFFRGALYAAVPRYPVLVSAVAYTIATLATGNVMLGFAAILLGLVVGLERRASGGVLAPILTHVTWSTIMLFALPLLF